MDSNQAYLSIRKGGERMVLNNGGVSPGGGGGREAARARMLVQHPEDMGDNAASPQQVP